MNPTPAQLNADAQLRKTVGHNGLLTFLLIGMTLFRNLLTSNMEQSVGMLSNAIRQNINAPLPEPRRTGWDIANDYEHASAQYHNAVISGDEMDIQFLNARRTNLRAEPAVIESSTVNSNKVRNNK